MWLLSALKARQNVGVRYQDREGKGRENCSGKINFFGRNTFLPSIRIITTITVCARLVRFAKEKNTKFQAFMYLVISLSCGFCFKNCSHVTVPFSLRKMIVPLLAYEVIPDYCSCWTLQMILAKITVGRMPLLWNNCNTDPEGMFVLCDFAASFVK